MLAAFATIAGTWALGRALLGRRVAVTAALVVATCPIVLVFGRLVIFDMVLTAFVTGAVYAMVRARLDDDATRWLPIAGFMVGCALLTKGPVGAVVPLVMWAAARGTLPAVRTRPTRLTVAITLLVPAVMIGVWVVAVQQREPDFLRYAVVEETLMRVGSAERFRRGGPPYYYLLMLPWALGLWLPLLVGVGPGLVRRMRARGPDAMAIRFAARAAGATLLFFTLSASKRPQYILPALVPLALLVAIGVSARPRLTGTMVRAAGWIAALVATGALIARTTGIVSDPTWSVFPVKEILPPVAATLLVWGLVATRAGRRPRPAIVCAAALTPFLFLAAVHPMAIYAERRSARRLAASIPSDASVVCFDTFRTSLPFYLKRFVTVLSDSGGALTSNYVVSQRTRLNEPTLGLLRCLPDVLAAARSSYVVVQRGQSPRLKPLAPDVHMVVVARDERSALVLASSPVAGSSSPSPCLIAPAQPTASSTGSAIEVSPPRTKASISSMRAPAS